MYGTRVLMLLPLLVGLAQSFSWDIVVGEDRKLKFYNDGTLSHTEDIPSIKIIRAVLYDSVDYRVLFAAYRNQSFSILSYDLTTGKIKTLFLKRTSQLPYNVFLAYDPLKQLLFWSEDTDIYSISLTPASSNTTPDVNLIVTLNDNCKGLAVDSCGGYIYWATYYKIERAAFDGSVREVLEESKVVLRRNMVIDQQTQTMFWSDEITYNNYSIESADFNGKNRRTFYYIGGEYAVTALTVSNDYIYWKSFNQRAILRLPKHQQYGVAPTVYAGSSTDLWYLPLTAANYTIEEQTLGMKGCEALKSLTHRSTAKSSSELELQGSGSTCVNYCFMGNCSISAEGLPNCSCYNGYSGPRCEANACHQFCLHDGVCSLNETEKPVCRCTGDYQGERCDVSICKDYCVQGNCSVLTEGQPTCSCEAGHTGERCEVDVCHKHCLHGGVCSLNEEEEPVCQCTAGYEGERCDVATSTTCVQAENTKQERGQDLHGEVTQVNIEELKHALLFFSDKIDEYEANIEIHQKSTEDQSV